MNAQKSTSALCIMLMLSPALAGVGGNVSPRGVNDGCHVQLEELVGYLKETAQLEGAALRVEYVDNRVNLSYPDFAQHLQCVDGVMHIHIGDPESE